MNINEALATLDPADDEFWTGDGMPRINVMQNLTEISDLTRAMITDAAPQFTRQTAIDAQNDLPAVPGAEPDDGDTDQEKDNVEASTEPDEAAAPTEEVMVEAPEPGMPIVEPPATATLEQLEAALVVQTEEMTKFQQIKVKADRDAKAASDLVNGLNRRIDGLTRLDPQAATRDLRNYISSQNEQRALRAGRVRKFLGETGVSPQDVAKSLEIRSPLDKAMHGRKPPRGTVRPQIQG